MQGHGVKTWPDGKQYDGMWVKGDRTGQGVMVWPDGSEYRGMASKSSFPLFRTSCTCMRTGGFKQGLFDGRGVHRVPSADEQYEGWFLAGKRHGQGELQSQDVHYSGWVGPHS